MQDNVVAYVPIFGTNHCEHPPEGHSKLWGIPQPGNQRVIQVLHFVKSDDDPGPAVLPGPTFNIFEAERAHMKFIDLTDTTVPDAVFTQLAKMALLGDDAND